ncbi:MAG: hypothetical protein IPH35_25475 [Rhodoferax sp.]|nr:hypothetical protein [Rhodoferax sp.]
MAPRLIGIRHHSPACARLVAHRIATERPAAVLIEGPSDFNTRIDELLLPHRLPIALYSYSKDDTGTGQCWFPFVRHSPEWVALTAGRSSGAEVRFIDLPHWQYRTVSDQERRRLAPDGEALAFAPDRHTRINQALAERTHCDGDHALWDHLFEASPLATSADFADCADLDDLNDLEERLGVYFHELRGDPVANGSPQDMARERYMASWLAWAVARFPGQQILLVCGGWHKRAIEALWPSLSVSEEPCAAAPADVLAGGAYLVPYEYRQLEALSGYAAGMQSPLYYEWLAEHGPAEAAERATRAIVERLRSRQIFVSTADCIALRATFLGLARLRGHPAPLRSDVLDAAQSAFIKEALDAPAPWSRGGRLATHDHPVLREALLALTGDGAGELAADTPLPPLVHDVARCLAECAIHLTASTQSRVLDRRRPDDARVAQTLWRLRLIDADGITLTALHAPLAARSLAATLAFEEHWQFVHTPRWLPSLIEAAAFGGTLEAAARARLLVRLEGAQQAQDIANGLTDAVRAGFFDLGDELLAALRQRIHASHVHGELATAALALLDVALAGFWGQDVRPLMQGALVAIGERLLWLLDCLQAAPGSTPGQASAGDAEVAAVRVLSGLLRLHQSQPLPGFDEAFTLASLLRFARASGTPPTLRGAAAGLAQSLQHRYPPDSGFADGELVHLTRAVPPRSQLGDYLYGLFALTRAVLKEQPELVQAVHTTLADLGDEDFLVALPALRAAFGWFPPRERGHIAAQVAAMLGLASGEGTRLTQLPQGEAAYLAARRYEARALAWAAEYGLGD